MAADSPTTTDRSIEPGRPGSASAAHPLDGIPLPTHGFAALDSDVQELASVPATEVISRAALLLMGAAAEKLGLTPGEEPDLDLVDARALINSLAGLIAAAGDDLGPDRETLHNGARTLQRAFREASARPDPPGEGPGERLLS